MPNEILKYVYTDTPLPSLGWRQLSDEERRVRIVYALSAGPVAWNGVIVVIAAKEDGQIILDLTESMPAAKRGTLLLDIEMFLKEAIDHGLVVWLKSLGDRNSLRNLRGIEVKS